MNLWFVGSLLNDYQKENSVYLVRPKKHKQYGFGELNATELIEIYKERTQITELDEITKLWKYYQQADLKQLLSTASKLQEKYPFIQEAVKAHIERIPTENYPGRPTATLMEIMQKLNTKEFGPVFQEFCKRESIYGFGDLQVKRLFDKIVNSMTL